MGCISLFFAQGVDGAARKYQVNTPYASHQGIVLVSDGRARREKRTIMPETILIVEDDPNDAVLLQDTLRVFGAVNPVQHVHSAHEAIAYLEGDFPYSDRVKYPMPKIILLDLKMPGMDGFDFLKWLQASGKSDEFSVFAVTALHDLESIRRAYSLGAKSFVPKPCAPADLENLCHTFPAHWARMTSLTPPYLKGPEIAE